MATAGNYYLRAAFFSDLDKSYFQTFALREVSVSENSTYMCTGGWQHGINIHLGVYIILPPYYSWQKQTVTDTWEPLPNHSVWHMQH